VIDDHTHPFALDGGPLDIAELSLDIGSEPGATERRARHSPTRTFHELITVRLAARLGCEPEEVSAARAEASGDWGSYVAGLFADGGITGMIMDPAYPPGATEQLDRYAELAGCPIHPMLRIDPLIDALLGRGASAAEIVASIQDAVAAAPSKGFVGYKTILAYRTGLAVDPAVTMAAAEASVGGDLPVRRQGKALRDLILRQALGLAADLGLPFQIHTGIGDSEIRLAESNPLLLEELLRSPEGQAATVVLIHGSWPWHEELAYLALTKPNVWADLSLHNLYSPVTTADRLLRMMDLAPASKLLMGTDGYHEPELFWFAATVLRDGWIEVRRRLSETGARSGWLDRAEVLMFEQTAKELYGL
jgi:hypothetical protein